MSPCLHHCARTKCHTSAVDTELNSAKAVLQKSFLWETVSRGAEAGMQVKAILGSGLNKDKAWAKTEKGVRVARGQEAGAGVMGSEAGGWSLPGEFGLHDKGNRKSPTIRRSSLEKAEGRLEHGPRTMRFLPSPQERAWDLNQVQKRGQVWWNDYMRESLREQGVAMAGAEVIVQDKGQCRKDRLGGKAGTVHLSAGVGGMSRRGGVFEDLEFGRGARTSDFKNCECIFNIQKPREWGLFVPGFL